MAVLSPQAINRLALEAGVKDPKARIIAVAVALAESGGNPRATHRNSDKNRTTDYGLWQINAFWHPQYAPAELLDPAKPRRNRKPAPARPTVRGRPSAPDEQPLTHAPAAGRPDEPPLRTTLARPHGETAPHRAATRRRTNSDTGARVSLERPRPSRVLAELHAALADEAAAAELLVPERKELLSGVQQLHARLERAMQRKLGALEIEQIVRELHNSGNRVRCGERERA